MHLQGKGSVREENCQIFIILFFSRDRCSTKDKWYSFNDAEVKSFDPNQIASECFGGEVNSRTYDQVTDKFLDLSIEKTNSAYMLFYERVTVGQEQVTTD